VITGHLKKYGNYWYVAINLRDPETGKRKKKWVSTRKTNKRDAEQVRIQLLAEYNQGMYVEPSKVTLAELLQRWLDDRAKVAVAESTYRRYESIVNNHLIPALGSIPLKDLTAAHIQQMYREHAEGGRLTTKGERSGEPLSPATVRQHHIVLNQALKQAVRWGLLARSPMDGVTPPKVARTEARAWTPEETNRFLAVAAQSEHFALYALALGTGMRRGELFALMWKDVDWERGTITVRRSLVQPGAHPRFKEPKTRSGWRLITLSPGLLAILHRHRTKQKEHRLFHGPNYEDHDLIFAQPNGRSLYPNNIVRREFRRLIQAAGVPMITFHDLRHTHATDLVRRGFHPKVIAARLGHSSISVTMDTYSHVMPEMQREAAEAFDDLLPDQELTWPEPNAEEREHPEPTTMAV